MFDRIEDNARLYDIQELLGRILSGWIGLLRIGSGGLELELEVEVE